MADFQIYVGEAEPSYGGAESVLVQVTSTSKETVAVTYQAQNNDGSFDNCSPASQNLVPHNGTPAQATIQITPGGTSGFQPGNINGVFTASGTYQSYYHTASTNY
jgi:hypothetical protein